VTTSKEFMIEAAASAGPELAFAPDEYRNRLDRVRVAMASARLDLLFLSAPESICYLSGYQAEWYQAQSPVDWQPASGIMIRADADDYLHFEEEDEVVLARLMSVSRDLRFHPHDGSLMIDFIVGTCKGRGWLPGRVGLEMWSYRPNRIVSERFQAALEAAGCQVVDATQIVRAARGRKSAQELAYTRTAQEIADIGMAAARNALGPGVTELEVYGEIVAAMARAGGENPGITMPVASGVKSACVHALASRRVIMPGDIVNVDVSGVYNRYHANMARCFSIGEPDPLVRTAVEKVYGAVPVVAETVRPQLPVRDLLDRMERYYAEAGILHDNWWIGGYELGIAFPPDWVGEFYYELGTDPADSAFEPGMVVNYEANFYLPRAAGMAMCINTLAFTEASAEFLQSTPAQLIVID
jgi:Xaa-Pro aminopeptidase